MSFCASSAVRMLERFRDGQTAPARPAGKNAGQHVPEVDADLLDRRALHQLERRHGAIPHFDLDRLRVETAGAQLLAQALAGRRRVLARHPCLLRRLAERRRRRRGQQQVEQPLFGRLRARSFTSPSRSSRTIFTRNLDEVAHHRLDVASRRSRPR